MAESFSDRILALPKGEQVEVYSPAAQRSRGGPGAWLESVLARASIGMGVLLPGVLRDLWLKALAALGRRMDRRHSLAAREFIQSALPEASTERVEELVRGAWQHLPRVAMESAGLRRMVGGRLGDYFDVETCDGLEDVLAADNGAMVITAHVGIWEALSLPLGAIGFSPFHAVAKPPSNSFLAAHMHRQRQESGALMIPRKGAMQAVPKVVRAGGAVLMLLDHRARQKPVVVPFFGRPAACDRSAGVLVRRVKAPLVFAACYRQGGSRPYRLVFSRVILPGDLDGLDASQVMRLVNQETERLILACPEQYFWLHDRYKGLPRDL